MTNATRFPMELVGAMAVLSLLVVPAIADDALTGDGLRALIVGNTVQGTMETSGGYAEFYRPDGTIRAATYSGTWSIEGNSFCTQVGADPRECWQGAKAGDEIHWLKDGKLDGTGRVTPGNPNNY
jgi:hypothetical protein